ncbi:MAG: ABC transporter permease [Myxococcota bacterium]
MSALLPSSRQGPWRGLGRELWSRPGARWGVLLIGVLLGTALWADFLACERPLLARIDGELYVLPNLLDPVELRAHTIDSLLESMTEEDWLIPAIVAWGPNQQDKGEAPLAAPSARHWLGTDTARRDVLARLIHGSRVAIFVGVVSVSIYVIIGTLVGLLAAFFGGWVDAVISRIIEAVMTIPVFFLILAVMGVVEQAGIGTMMVVIGLVYWTRVARLVRAEALRVRSMAYIEAAIALGYSGRRIILRHILPNSLGPVLVTATFGIAAAILVEASLSFLGFGTPDSTASWGTLLRGAMGNFHAWWLVLFPGAAIFVTVTAYNMTGEALRDALDPRLRHDADAMELTE